jgi:hypothetical protein
MFLKTLRFSCRIEVMLKPLVCLMMLAGCLNAAEPVALFDGRSLDGWKASAAPEYWTAKDGVLIGKSDAKKTGSILWTTKDYGDFVLESEFLYNGKIDSGFFLRNESEQIQLGISGSLKRDMTCSPYIGKKKCYPVAAVGVDLLLKEGEWNQMKIEVKGKKYTVTLNGKQVLEYTTDAEPVDGPIGLQLHPGVEMEIHFRNLRLTALDEK